MRQHCGDAFTCVQQGLRVEGSDGCSSHRGRSSLEAEIKNGSSRWLTCTLGTARDVCAWLFVHLAHDGPRKDSDEQKTLQI